MRPRLALLVLFLGLVLGSVLGCTDAGLYAVGAGGVSSGDRADFEGTVCVPLATGEAFPVKVLYAMQGGEGVDRAVVGQAADALNSVASRFSVPYINFSLVAFHTVATGLQGSFADSSALGMAVAKYSAYQEQGPVSLRAPLKLARSILSGDMQTGCRGAVARARYLVVLVYSAADTSCQNPAFNAGIDSRCQKLLPDEAACSQCELTTVTSDLKALADRYGAGEVTIQPIYVRTVADPLASAQGQAVARSGGTVLLETDPASLKTTLNAVNYASLQRALAIKRLIAINRSTLARNQEVLVDSDGDGISDRDEEAIGTLPDELDSDGDGIMDGIELRMGMRPQPDPNNANVDVINGCNPSLDTDGDRLNDCEERVLGTDACISDSDGDGVPELVELLSGTNPLIAEDLADDDNDGLSNIGEIETHTDVHSADIAFRGERGYTYAVTEVEPTEDGRACYHFIVGNVGLGATLARKNAPFDDIPKGTNDVYLYFQVGRQNDPRGTGIGSLHISQIRFTPPNKRKPAGVIHLTPDDFVLGN